MAQLNFSKVFQGGIFMNIAVRFSVIFMLLLTCLFGVELNNLSSVCAMSLAHPEDGVYSLQPQSSPGYELAVQNAGTNNGANVVIWQINNGNNQRWKFERLGGGNYYKITAENSGRSLDVEGKIGVNGANLQVWSYAYQGNQQFLIWDCGDGYYVIQPNLSGNYVLDVDHGKSYNGNNVIIWTASGQSNQKWKLVRFS